MSTPETLPITSEDIAKYCGKFAEIASTGPGKGVIIAIVVIIIICCCCLSSSASAGVYYWNRQQQQQQKLQ